MSAAEGLKERLTTEWDIRGIDLATVQVDGRGTIMPSRISSTAGVLESLPRITTTRGEPDGVPEVELFDALGEGGMGIVLAAEQTALRRQVAIKRLRADKQNPSTTRQLLREARITGALEHPNVVPVHALGTDEEDRPLIIMKRIEGTSWLELLELAKRDPDGGLPKDLQRHLEILIQVARAVHFAHSRHIVHRDLKPENVMIGSFGEVYVVDWGLAVSTQEDGVADVPLARNVASIAGTPEYMAPEMSIGDGTRIDERTDVYLLGAMLHEVITGQPPHEADTMLKALTAAYASKPPAYHPSVSGDLVSIAHCAMSREPEERFQTANAFATALEGFLTHRASTVLSDEASERLMELSAAIPAAADNEDADDRELLSLFSECRFGFNNALRIWRHNETAREGLQQALELMIGYELDRGSAGAAAGLLAELPEERPLLAKRIEIARQKSRRAEDELERIAREADPTLADKLRGILAISFGLTGGAALLFFGFASRSGLLDAAHFEVAGVNAFFLISSLLASLFARKKLLVNSANLRSQLTILLIYGTFTALWPLADGLGISLHNGFVLQLMVGTFMYITGATVVDRRLIAMGISMMLGLGAVLLWPRYGFEWLGLTFIVGSTIVAWARYRTKSAAEARPLSQYWSRSRINQYMPGSKLPTRRF